MVSASRQSWSVGSRRALVTDRLSCRRAGMVTDRSDVRLMVSMLSSWCVRLYAVARLAAASSMEKPSSRVLDIARCLAEVAGASVGEGELLVRHRPVVGLLDPLELADGLVDHARSVVARVFLAEA